MDLSLTLSRNPSRYQAMSFHPTLLRISCSSVCLRGPCKRGTEQQNNPLSDGQWKVVSRGLFRKKIIDSLAQGFYFLGLF